MSDTIGDSLKRENEHFRNHFFPELKQSKEKRMTEVETSNHEVMVPVTGEVIDLASPTDTLAEASQRIRELETELARVRASIGMEIVKRMDHENLRSAEVGDFSLTVDAPGGVDWEAKKLEEALWWLVDHDQISGEAMDRVLPMKRSVGLRELKKLLPSLSDEDRARVEACSAPSKKVRRVRVERLR